MIMIRRNPKTVRDSIGNVAGIYIASEVMLQLLVANLFGVQSSYPKLLVQKDFTGSCVEGCNRCGWA